MPASTNWPAVLAAVLCGVAVAMNIGKVPIVMTQLREQFHLSMVAVGWVSSMINTMAAVSALLFGLAGARVGAMRMCFFGLGMSLLGCLGGFFVTTGSGLLLSRFAEGVGMVSVVVSAPALASAASTLHDRRFALSIWGAYMPAGIGSVMLLTPLLMPLDGWYAVWMLTLAVMVAAVIAVYRHRHAYHLPVPAGGHMHFAGMVKEALSQPAAWLLGLSLGLWSVQHFTLIIWLPTFLREQRHTTPFATAMLTCVMVLMSVFGNLVCGRFLHRGARRSRLIMIANTFTALSCLGIFLDVLPDLLRYALCLFLSFIGSLVPASVLSSSVSLARSPRQIVTLQGLFIQFSNLGGLLAPPAIAMLVAASGQWRDAGIVPLSAALVSIAAGRLIGRYKL